MSQKVEVPVWWQGGKGTDGKVGFNDRVFAKPIHFRCGHGSQILFLDFCAGDESEARSAGVVVGRVGRLVC